MNRQITKTWDKLRNVILKGNRQLFDSPFRYSKLVGTSYEKQG